MVRLQDVVLGSALGFIIEKIAAPELPGAFPLLPLRPIYGIGAGIASDSPLRNMLISICVEQLIALKRPDLWRYNEGDGLLLTSHVKLQNNAMFGVLMTMYAKFASASRDS